MTTPVKCPDNARWPGDIVGCGREITTPPDEEGIYDCPHCGIFFKWPETKVNPLSPRPQITAKRQCTRCGHKQEVISACADYDKDGNIVSYYFGSSYHYCDVCDGPCEAQKETT
jgi:DNA-directed RNA polymerase subunit RPC12/RpoP